MKIHFANTYSELPAVFFDRVAPNVGLNSKSDEGAKLQLPFFNKTLASQLGIEVAQEEYLDFARLMCGDLKLEGLDPIAMAYAGHQFGHFVPQLGDGRAILLGEVLDPRGERFDLHLKGSGQTKFSRRGDGRAAIGPMLRECIVSEFLAVLKIPTTRALALALTGEKVFREVELPGAVLLRVAKSHLRVGTFEYFAARREFLNLKILADYTMKRHFDFSNSDHEGDRDFRAEDYSAFFLEVCRRQARLMAQWMGVGFVHGVMNTDNMLLSGESIDFGPCAFLDEFDSGKVFSSIDHKGRYAYNNQATMAQWNLSSLGQSLFTLLADTETNAEQKVRDGLEVFVKEFNQSWLGEMCEKLGIVKSQEGDILLLREFLGILQEQEADYTLSFRKLSFDLGDSKKSHAMSEVAREYLSGSLKETESYLGWKARWLKRVGAQDLDLAQVARFMEKKNPLYIPRNHLVEEALDQATLTLEVDAGLKIMELLQHPFDYKEGFDRYLQPPKPEQRVCQTFCGT